MSKLNVMQDMNESELTSQEKTIILIENVRINQNHNLKLKFWLKLALIDILTNFHNFNSKKVLI